MLPLVENGVIVLIGATTENPGFSIINPLISRVKIFRFTPHSSDSIKSLINKALSDKEIRISMEKIVLSDDVLDLIINGSNGDAPAMGDWFWDTFSGTGYKITGWDALWASGAVDRNDLQKVKDLGVNTIRVYSMLSRQVTLKAGYPKKVGGKEVYEYVYPAYPFDPSVHLFTHTNFLDACESVGLSVLVGVPLPEGMFWKDHYVDPTIMPPAEIAYWPAVLKETVEQVGSHKAVLGFIIQNEQDNASHCYGNPTYATFWWSQVEAMAKIAKDAAPNKLVGMAVHDDPQITLNCQTYMADCPSLDFWGVNTYQTLTLLSIFDNPSNPPSGYNLLTGAALKPVILTEFGIPATGHTNRSDPNTIYSNDHSTSPLGTENKTAAILDTMLPQAYGAPPAHPLPAYNAGLCLGLYYFEYCDEWWSQGGAPNIYTWYGGVPDLGLPNGFWDQDGFGVYSVARGGTLASNAPIWNQTGGYG